MSETENRYRELHRIAITQPMSTTPYPEHRCARPVLLNGERVQVTAFFDEHGRIVERWQLNDDDVRWYELQALAQRRVTIKVERRSAIGK